MRSISLRIAAALVCLHVAFQAHSVTAETVARCGQGWLERIDGYPVLHLKGSPREMGFQHGVLLSDAVHANLKGVIQARANVALVEVGPFTLTPATAIRSGSPPYSAMWAKVQATAAAASSM